jgi:molybdenum cofactor cytidylyltransferase
MGRPKLLLPWRASTVLAHLITQYTQLGSPQIAVVVAESDREILQELERLKFNSKHCIVNPHPEKGMFSSIQCAARWTGWQSDLTHWIISLGDQPHLRANSIRSLLAFASAHAESICQPEWRGRPKHPVVLPRCLFAELATCDSPHLKAFLEQRSAHREMDPADDPGLDLDLDYPADYEKALRIIDGDEISGERPSCP